MTDPDYGPPPPLWDDEPAPDGRVPEPMPARAHWAIVGIPADVKGPALRGRRLAL